MAAAAGPIWVFGHLLARPGANALQTWRLGFAYYSQELAKMLNVALSEARYAIVSGLILAAAALGVAILLAFRRPWALRAFFALLAVTLLNGVAVIAFRPGRLRITNLQWDSVAWISAEVLILASRPVRRLFNEAGQTGTRQARLTS